MDPAVRRASGIEAVGDVAWGSHLGHIYGSDRDLGHTVRPWLEAGLLRNERCLLVLGALGGAWSALADSLPDAASLRRSGRLRVVVREGVLSPATRPTAQDVERALLALEREALADGLDGLRIASDLGSPLLAPWSDVVEHERHVGAALAKRRALLLCSCDGRAIDGSAGLEVARLHQCALHGLPEAPCVLRCDSPDTAELQRTCDRLQDFVAMVAHDLRNPLGAITLASGQLRRDVHCERGLRAVGRIEGAARRMSGMVSELLELARARSGRPLPLHVRPVDLSLLACRVVDERTPSSGPPRIVLTSHGDPRLVGDEGRLERVLCNLVSNALVHGSGGPVQVEVDGEDADVVRLQIRNRGEVPAALLGSLFQPWVSTSAPRSGERDNLGLGLYIAERIVTAHGGTLAVTSSAVDGTTFTATLRRGAL